MADPMADPVEGDRRTLVLLRHSKSAWPSDTADIDRDLAPRGRRDAPAVGRWLRRNLPAIDLAVCSPAVRARRTWALAGAQLDVVPPDREDDRLYGATAEDLLQVTRELPASATTVVLVGHNPGLEHFLEVLSGAAEMLKTSALAVLGTAVTDWSQAAPGSWTLRTLETPRGE
jgi:phosphohistidine phosphatase